MAYFYAVKVGRKPGVYNSWPECQDQVTGIKGAKFKKFPTKEEAEQFAKEGQKKITEAPTRITPVFNITKQVKRHLEAEEPEYAKRTKSEQPISQYVKKMKTIVYTDGACSGNGQVGSRAGYGVYWGDDDARNTSERLLGKQTNQRAEATAVIHALKQSQRLPGLLEIRTDSRYVINAVTDWSKAWIKNGWKSAKGKPVENKDVFEEILNLMDTRKGPVEFVYVAGHTGEEGNEKADQLAVEGAQK
ncbi:Ribonuclease H1 [Rhizopus stolonifer]|uniref:ribonuclease H n=1 Tax=Rhizopus stolonifer TaxID=4846 RepID=A0A367KMW3_RHIST|nr:Ribonuclease H1 [Rhizopus stolonifer]